LERDQRKNSFRFETLPQQADRQAPVDFAGDFGSLNATVKLSLRTYTLEDFETLYEIDQECYEPALAYSKREFGNYLRFPGAECVIAEENGNTAGFCLTAHQRARGTIITIDVLEKFRRRGVGTALLAEAERRLAAHA